MTRDEFETHGELLRAVDTITTLTVDRGRLALLTDEAEQIGNDVLWLVLEPVGSAMLGQGTAALVRVPRA